MRNYSNALLMVKQMVDDISATWKNEWAEMEYDERNDYVFETIDDVERTFQSINYRKEELTEKQKETLEEIESMYEDISSIVTQMKSDVDR